MDHRAKAEALLARSTELHSTSPAKPHMLAEANAHATLALLDEMEKDRKYAALASVAELGEDTPKPPARKRRTNASHKPGEASE